jgi:quinohemoprotein ethanol dehydrogenase
MSFRGFLTAAALLVAACSGRNGTVDERALAAAPGNEGEWLTYGRTYDEQRHSPLAQIDRANVGRLGLAWYADLDTARGQEATPLVIDGAIFISTAWSKVKAFDARSGRPLWSYDPKVPPETAVKACCDVVNRGLAAWGNKLYLGTLDGRLVALDRNTGRELWSRQTVDSTKNYTITGAPRAVRGLIVIGNSGAEMGVRGYVSAYDAESGRLAWRFYTVPDAPGKNGPAYLRKAEKTWNGRWWEQGGGGGTVWDSMAYDAELDLLYIGVGNGSPWNQAYRSPGGGDNLYLASVVAVRPTTGEYVWHYQTTPGETWDYTATQHMILADLPIGGFVRKVLMQAPKNGFFYVLDRTDGKLISAKDYAPVNWASEIDLASGRPIEAPEARYDRTGEMALVTPGPSGAHGWQPMAFDPATKLVFIPVMLTTYPFVPQRGWKPAAMGPNTGTDTAASAIPADSVVRTFAAKVTKGELVAWDPVAQTERWRVPMAGPWNGGLLATAGGLVFQGNAAGEFAAYETATGRRLWSFPAQTGIVAPPVTYSLDGRQYVAVLAGWGGLWALTPGYLSEVSGPVRNVSRLLVFALDAKATLPPLGPLVRAPLDPPPSTATSALRASGQRLYARFCSSCHGESAYGSTVLPDLRRSAALSSPENWRRIVIGGELRANGMVSFAPVVDALQADSIRHYVIGRAHEDKALTAHGAD